MLADRAAIQNLIVAYGTALDTLDPDGYAAVFTEETFEHGVEVAASISESVAATGRPGRMLIVGEDEPAVAAAGAESIMDRLAAAERSVDPDPLRLLETVDRATRGGALVVITGADEPGVLARLAEQRRRFAPVVVLSVIVPGTRAPVAHRKPGMAILYARTGAEGASAWNQLVIGGGIG